MFRPHVAEHPVWTRCPAEMPMEVQTCEAISNERGASSTIRSPMRLTLRQPEPADYQTLASWVPDAFNCLRWAGPRVSFPFTVAEFSDRLAVAGGESYFLAEERATPCAFGQHWVLVPGAVHLGRIIVAPAARGRGIGRMLCEQLIEQAIQRAGANIVTLRVYDDNLAAVKLYSRLGFVPVASESDAEVLFMNLKIKTSVARTVSGCA